VTLHFLLLVACTVCLGSGLLFASVVDWRELRLPDYIALPLIFAGLLVVSLGGEGAELHTRALTVGAAFAFFAGIGWYYRRLRGVDALGLGDAKLFAAAGAWLGPSLMAPMVFVSAVLALLFTLALRLRGRKISSTTVVPFGPFLSTAFFGLWCLKLAGWQFP
jgi:leader peptidase (prepilin peptidase)/N-methyltransferase